MMDVKQPTRPWILRGRTRSWRTKKWGGWRSVATYATPETANDAVIRAGKAWGSSGDFYICHRDNLSQARSAEKEEATAHDHP